MVKVVKIESTNVSLTVLNRMRLLSCGSVTSTMIGEILESVADENSYTMRNCSSRTGQKNAQRCGNISVSNRPPKSAAPRRYATAVACPAAKNQYAAHIPHITRASGRFIRRNPPAASRYSNSGRKSEPVIASSLPRTARSNRCKSIHTPNSRVAPHRCFGQPRQSDCSLTAFLSLRERPWTWQWWSARRPQLRRSPTLRLGVVFSCYVRSAIRFDGLANVKIFSARCAWLPARRATKISPMTALRTE